VQGIAFQDGSANGVAVVNGVAVSNGSVIEGVRVEEIQNDRVTFSRDGKKFEIVLDKSN
jgi:general secretion pathway protein B